MVPLAQPPATAEVGRPHLVQTRHHVHADPPQQGDQEIRAVTTVAQQNVARAEVVQQLAQQGRLARLLSLIRPQGHATHHGRGQGEQDHHAGDGKADTFLLRAVLRIALLVLLGVGHADSRAVGQIHVTVVPQPLLGNRLLAAAGHVQGQPPEERFGQLGPRPAILAGVVRDADFQCRHEDHDTRSGSQTTPLFVFEQHLRQEGPQGDGRSVDDFLIIVVIRLAEVDALFVASLLDVILSKYASKGQAGDLQEGVQHQAKSLWQ